MAEPSKSTVCVTGATGFVGAAVTAALHDAGANVRATYRSRDRLAALEGLEVKSIKADVLDRRSMRRALEGCDVLFHVAGIVGSARPDAWDVNARGPERAIEAAAAADVPCVVLTSSVAAIGPSRRGQVADERQVYRTAGLGLTYPNSKYEGEARALAAAARTGVELVTVCPSYVLGAPDARGIAPETSTRLVSNYLRGRLPAVVDSWTNVVDVEDVAVGHLLAWKHGEPGERYILGGTDVAWPELIRRVGALAGVDYPVTVIPPAAVAPARLARGLALSAPTWLEAIGMMAQDHCYSSEKAERELGYQSRSLDQTLRRSIRWFMEELEAGAFSGPDLSGMRLTTGAVHVAERSGALPVARAAGGLLARLADR